MVSDVDSGDMMVNGLLYNRILQCTAMCNRYPLLSREGDPSFIEDYVLVVLQLDSSH